MRSEPRYAVNGSPKLEVCSLEMCFQRLSMSNDIVRAAVLPDDLDCICAFVYADDEGNY